MNSYRDLKVWQEAMLLAERIYRITAKFPDSERYGLISQMRRAALENALGSLFELETQSELSVRLGFAGGPDSEELESKIRGLGRGLTALMRYVAEEAEDR